MSLPMITQCNLAKDGYNDLNLILDLVIVNRYRAKYIDLALDVLDTIEHNAETQVRLLQIWTIYTVLEVNINQS